MDDKELLELAALAAGYHSWDFLSFNEDELMNVYGGDGTQYSWNPLKDDGDALRLAVKLQLTVCNDHVSSGAAYCFRGDEELFPDVMSGSNEDHVIESDYVATRRAIVLAAAEIGKQQ